MPGHRFSKEEMNEMLLYHAKKQKSKAIGALIIGPIVTAFGIYVSNKDPYTISQSGNSMTIRENKTVVIGKVIGTTGILTTLTSIPLFILAGKAKREAKLVLSDQSTSMLRSRITIPSFGIQIKM
ncbi:MAG TPA: hypothetical protein VJ499_12985 [Flavisolibacter sp.]|nr:hypothetical protein [Flavisolibacter sp.]